MNDGSGKKFMRIKTAAEVYDWDRRKLRDWCLLGKIPGAVKPTGAKEWWIPVASMEALMSSVGRGNV